MPVTDHQALSLAGRQEEVLSRQAHPLSFRATGERGQATLVPALTLNAALVGLGAMGLDPERVLAPVGLEREHLHQPFACVPVAALSQLWTSALRLRPDPALPIDAGLSVPFGEFGVLDHLVASASRVGEMLHLLNLFFWLASTNLSLDFSHEQGDWIWIDSDPSDPNRSVIESWTLALILRRFGDHLPGFTVDEVRLSEKAFDTRPVAERLRTPVRAGCDRTGFLLAPGVWNLPNRRADAALHATLRTVAERVEFREFEHRPLIYAIHTRLPEALQQGAFTADNLAAVLGLSRRTLQRRLSNSQLTFKALLDAYRRDAALQMLEGGERTMAEIAYALGYAEQSSFNRAFRRWTGQAPSDWLASRR